MTRIFPCPLCIILPTDLPSLPFIPGAALQGSALCLRFLFSKVCCYFPLFFLVFSSFAKSIQGSFASWCFSTVHTFFLFPMHLFWFCLLQGPQSRLCPLPVATCCGSHFDDSCLFRFSPLGVFFFFFRSSGRLTLSVPIIGASSFSRSSNFSTTFRLHSKVTCLPLSAKSYFILGKKAIP